MTRHREGHLGGAIAGGYDVLPRPRPAPLPRPQEARRDSRVAAAGLALVAPLVLAMLLGSTVLILLASVLVLVVSLLAPMTGMIALAFASPYPRPLVIPTPGLYVALIGAILLGVVFRLPIERPRLRWPSLEVWIAGAFLFYVAVHFGAWVIDGPSDSRGNAVASLFSQFMTGILTFLVAGLVVRQRSPYPILAALLASALLASTTAIGQSIGAEGLFGGLMGPPEEVNPTAVDRVTGPFLDPNYFGAYLAAATTLALACAVIARSVVARAALLAVSAYVGIALVLTLSRGALVALVTGIITIAFTRGVRTGLLAIGGMVLVAVIAWPFFADVRFAADPGLAQGGLGSQLENSDRTDAWLAGVEVFLSSPIFGVGWGRLVEETSTGIEAHNWYVTVLAETGITGLILWGLFLLSTVMALRRRSLAARTVGLSVMAAWAVASLFIEVPLVYGATSLALIVLALTIAGDWDPSDRRDLRRELVDLRAGVPRIGAGRRP